MPETPTTGFLWGRLHISSGAAVMFLVMFIFMGAIYKIDNSNISQSKQISESVCKVIAAANKGQQQTKDRISASIERYDKAGRAEERIASVWRYAKSKQPVNTPPSQVRLVDRLINSTDALADQDRAFADDLRTQLAAVRPIVLQGC